MTLDWEQLAAVARDSLSEPELQTSVVYLDKRIYEAGDEVPFNRGTRVVDSSVVLAFVDLQPEANWSHPARYLFIEPDTGTIEQIEGNFFPPYRSPIPETFRLAWQGQAVPDWPLLTNQAL